MEKFMIFIFLVVCLCPALNNATMTTHTMKNGTDGVMGGDMGGMAGKMGGMGDMDGMDMHGNHTNHGGMDMMMPMYFQTSNKVTLFFKGWKTTTNTEFNGACTAIALLAFLYEGFKVLRQMLAVRQMVLSKVSGVTPTASSDYKTFDGMTPSLLIGPARGIKIALHVVQTLLHMIQIFFGYLLMLAFMTYNTGICVAVILGFGMGYLFFGWYSPSNNMKVADGECCNM